MQNSNQFVTHSIKSFNKKADIFAYMRLHGAKNEYTRKYV